MQIVLVWSNIYMSI